MKKCLLTLACLLMLTSTLVPCASSEEQYPQLDISGFKKWEFKDVSVSPQSQYFTGISQLGGFTPSISGGPWQERLQLKILGRLSERLSVAYDLEQQPELPDKYDVKVKYDENELTFGDIQANFSGNEFASASKFVNGVMFTAKSGWYDIITVPSSKLKSQTQPLSTQNGNNTKGPYSLGHGSIVEGSERIKLNDVLLKRNVDYTIDYFDGKITFTDVLAPTDKFEYTYEYTNIIDIFFPTLSKRDFFGFQSRFTINPDELGKVAPQPEPVIEKAADTFPRSVSVSDKQADPFAKYEALPFIEVFPTGEGESLNSFDLAKKHIIVGTEKITFMETILKKNEDYQIDYRKGRIKLFLPFLPEVGDPMKIEYQYRHVPEDANLPDEESLLSLKEEEESGTYRITQMPIVNFSESIYFMGTRLNKNEDYSINYGDGTIKLFTRFLPTADSPLEVSYKYYLVSNEAETISGVGSRGPYLLKHKNLAPGSERIWVDEKVYVRDLDYTIDYASGTLFFSYNIALTSAIKAKYQFQKMELPKEVDGKFKKEFIIGTTYLRESAKKGAGAPTATVIDTKKASDVISNNNTIYLDHFPIATTEEATLTVKANGVTLNWGTDYIVPSTEVDASTGIVTVIPSTKLAYINDRTDPSNGYYTGSIKILNNSVSSGEVTISYTYKKSIVGSFNGIGDGSRGPYYIRNIRNIVPGTETVQVFKQGSSAMTSYVRNSSFEADAGHQGYSINYDANNPYIMFNDELASDNNFKVIFQQLPPSVDEGGEISQDVMGADIKVKLGDVFELDSALAKSQTDQVYVSQPSIESFSGNGTGKYNLHSPENIIDGSEKVSVNGNYLNRDIDYFMSYTKPGQLSFYYISPATADAVSVEYNYQSSSGIISGQDKKEGSAYRVGVATNFLDKKVAVSGNMKQVDYDFTPMGSVSIANGSRYKDLGVNLRPDYHSLAFDYSYKEHNNPIGTNRGYFTNTYDNNFSTSAKPYGLAAITYNYRNYWSVDDPLSPGSLHTSDTLQDAYNASLAPNDIKYGHLSFTQKYDARRTISKTDVVDNLNPTRSVIDYLHANTGLNITERLQLGYDFQLSEPVTRGLITSTEGTVVTTVEGETAHALTRDNSYSVTLDLTFPGFDKLLSRISLQNHEGINLLADASSALQKTRNETYHIEVVPFKVLSTAFDHSRQETRAVVVGTENPRTERTASRVNLTPHSSTTLSWNGAWNTNIQENGRKSGGKSNTYSINYIPISFSQLKITTNFSKSDRSALAPSGDLEVNTDTENFSQTYAVNFIPHSLIPLSYSFTQNDYRNRNDSVTSPVSTETQDQTTSLGFSFKPVSFFDLSAGSSTKTTRDLRADQIRPKNNVSVKANYQMFSWGILVYDWNEERNKGEVQAGSVVDLDLKKTTTAYSLNVTVPQNNPILSSIVLIATLKRVEYTNYLKEDGSDDFNASLMTFEGSLNF